MATGFLKKSVTLALKLHGLVSDTQAIVKTLNTHVIVRTTFGSYNLLKVLITHFWN